MCECLSYEDGSEYLCEACGPRWREYEAGLSRPPADAATEAVEDESPFAVADSIEEGRALEHCSPTDLPAATYLKGLVYRLVGAFDRVEMRRRALWDSHGKLLIQQKVAQKLRPRPSAEWHEDFGEALWFVLPIREAPYCGSPLADDWPFGEDGDDEGATWPALAEDQTLVWVPVEPIARLVEALSTPAPAPSASRPMTRDEADAVEEIESAMFAQSLPLPPGVREAAERLRAAIAKHKTGCLCDACDSGEDLLAALSSPPRPETTSRPMTRDEADAVEEIESAMFAAPPSDAIREAAERLALLRMVAAEGCRDKPGSGVTCREAGVPPDEVCEVCRVIKYLSAQGGGR